MTDEELAKIGHILDRQPWTHFSIAPSKARKLMNELDVIGYAIVPRAPTPEMIKSALEEVDRSSYDVTKGYITEDDLCTGYNAMVRTATTGN